MKKGRFRISVFFIAAVLFALLSVRGTQKHAQIPEAVFLPFSSALDPASILSRNQVVSFVPFLGDGYLGYVDSSEKRLYAAQFTDRAAIDFAGWILYDRLATSLRAFSLGSRPSIIAGYGYPWFKSSRRFIIRADQMGISELHADGSIKWEKEFSMPITAIDATPAILGIGCLDGSFFFLGANGEQLYSELLDSQQDSKPVRTIYGMALSSDEKHAAVLCGISPQKIVAYRRAGTGFSKSSELELTGGMPLQTAMCYAEDGSHVLIAQGERLFYYNAQKNYIRKIANDEGWDSQASEGSASETARPWAAARQYVLGPIGENSIAVLQVGNMNPPQTRVLIMKHGITEREEIGAVSASAAKDSLILVLRDGVKVVKGWQQ